MAIIRKGIKIGTFDIRLGLPRDRGFDPAEAAKRKDKVDQVVNLP